MNILLDTHIFLWYITGDSRMPPAMLEAIRSPRNQVYLSVVSIWEAIIKYQLGKLRYPIHLTAFFHRNVWGTT